MNIVLREMKANMKSLIIWCIAIIFMVGAGMGKFAGMSSSPKTVNELLSQLPEAFRAIFGLGNFDLTKASGFFGVLFIYLALMAVIHASMLGAGIIAKEERDRTVEFLLVKPVSRAGIVTSKLTAALINVIIYNAFTWIFSLVFVNYYSNGEAISGYVTTMMIAMFIMQLMFLFIGSGIAAFIKNSKMAQSIATSILLGSYIIYVIIALNSKLDFLKYFSPFKYFDANNMMYSGKFDPVMTALAAAVIIVMCAVTYVFYNKRDMKTT